MVRIPSFADSIGPIVLPQGESFLTTNCTQFILNKRKLIQRNFDEREKERKKETSCSGTDLISAISRRIAVVTAVVAYLHLDIRVGIYQYYFNKPLICVLFYNNTFIHGWSVSFIVLLTIIRMNCMCHISLLKGTD